CACLAGVVPPCFTRDDVLKRARRSGQEEECEVVGCVHQSSCRSGSRRRAHPAIREARGGKRHPMRKIGRPMKEREAKSSENHRNDSAGGLRQQRQETTSKKRLLKDWAEDESEQCKVKDGNRRRTLVTRTQIDCDSGGKSYTTEQSNKHMARAWQYPTQRS